MKKKPAKEPDSEIKRVRMLADDQYIVGIGASAGGLEAIQELFDNTPSDSNVSFIIVQHLSPDYKSLMAELLSKHTPMHVYEAENGIPVEPGCVYVIPSKKTMTIKNGKIKLTEKKAANIPNNAIDIFFKSLAEEKGNRSIGVILSGTGTDGTKGVDAIKKAGGLVIVQDPVTAKFDGMPNSAIIAGHADFILSPELMPEEIFNYVKELPIAKAFRGQVSKQDELTFTQILSLIHQHASCDFTLYKRPTIMRRISRRMATHNISKLADYLDFLHHHPGEIDILCKEFLIGVTRFFRDPEAFEFISRNVIPSIVDQKKNKEQVKIWVPACSTGEEAYTIAMLFRECCNKLNKEISVKIFATDLDREAINHASSGVYPESISKDITAERLNEHFIREGKRYMIHPEVRKMVIFAHHDIIKDPPFSKMDMVSCRNMLIYMNPVLQKKILSLFMFALNYGGYLFLGSSETPGESKNGFTEVSKKWKIYKNTATIRTLSRDALQANTIRPFTRAGLMSAPAGKNTISGISEVFNDIIGEEFGYAGILIDETYELKQAVGDFNKYLSFPSRRLNFNVLKMVPEELSVAIGTVVRRALKSNERVVMKNIRVRDHDSTRTINVLVKPFQDSTLGAQRHAFIILHDEKQVEDISKSSELFDKQVYDKERMLDMELELKETKENLQSAIEELETSNEELQSSNEELLSANEELQSTNEELQSLNEELHTVNTEHQLKIKELMELNDDLNNYFRSSNIGQLFVDRNLIIRKFTPAAVHQVNLIDSDIGRPITHISSNIRYNRLIDDIEYVIETSETIEKEIEGLNQRWYQMRVVPYVKRDKKTDGVVITFVDITTINKLNAFLNGVLNSSLNGISAFKAVRTKGRITDFQWVLANKALSERFGKKENEMPGKLLLSEAPSYKKNGIFEKYIQVVETGQTLEMEYKAQENDRWYKLIAVKLDDGLMVTHSDITDKREAGEKVSKAYDELLQTEEKLRQLNSDLEKRIQERTRELAHTEERFRLVAKVTNDAVYDRNLVTNTTWWNEGFTTLFGYKSEENDMEAWYSQIHPDDAARVKKKLQDVISSGTAEWTDEYRIRTAKGTYAYILDRGYLLQDEYKTPVRMVGAIMDLTPLKEKERQQRQLIAIIENSTDFIGFASPEGSIVYINPSGLQMIGVNTMAEIHNKPIKELFTPKDKRFFEDHIAPELEKHGHWEGEFQLRNFRNNSPVLVHYNIFSIMDDEGRITGYGTVTRDIRRELAFRRAITEGAERLRLMANSMPQKVWTATAEGMTDYFNEQWMRYTGKPINDLMGDGWLRVIHPDDKRETIRQWEEVVKSGEFYQVEHRIKRADTVYRWHLTRALAHRDEQGRILGWVGSTTDIDEQKKQEEKKDEFIGIASHELKTPLTSLKAYTQLVEAVIKENNPDIKKLETYISKTGTYIDKLNGLVSDLLDVSKIQSGKLTFDMQDVDFDAMVMDSIDILMHTNHHKLIIEGKTGKSIKGDKTRLEQVVENLISNAVKYSPKADKVIVSLSIEDNCVKFSVKDFGIGIPPDKLDNIFNRFYRVEGMTHKFQGLGIGLYISSEIVKRHKGKIWADSIVGEGSTFYFTLPIAE